MFIDVLLNLQQGREPWDEILDPFCPPKRTHFMADIFRMIEYWKIPFNMPSPAKPNCNTAMAIAAILEKDGIDHAGFCTAVFKSVWQEQLDGNDPSVLRTCLETDRLDPGLINRAESEGRNLLTQNTVSAYERGVFGVPIFILNDDLYFGADRMEVMAEKL